MFYANDTYRKDYLKEELPDPPQFSDCVAVGFNGWVSEAVQTSGLADDLTRVFGEEESRMILDLASFMISRESAVMQHFPAWARDHMLFSENICSDTTIGRFLKDKISVSKINQFKDYWFIRNIDDGSVYLCYDSTNVNCQARGVSIVEMGNAKDDASLPQVNSDYVVRQKDGLPMSYLHSPGSITDIAQAQEMLAFIRKAKELTGRDLKICLICDRGYISEKNVRDMDRSGISYLLMLKSNFKLYQTLADSVIDAIKSYKNELESDDDEELYGVTVPCRLYEDGPECCAHVIWSNERYRSERKAALKSIELERKKLESFITGTDGKSIEPRDLEWVPKYFRLITEPGEPKKEVQKKRGRGNGTKTVLRDTVRIIRYEEDENLINREVQKAGIMVLISREQMTVQESLNEYGKRDCVEKVFEALKSHLGMDKLGVSTEAAMHGKGLIWFIASILHALLFIGTSKLRASDRKNYTVTAMVDQLEAIKADRDLRSGNYKRRYKITHRQMKILRQWGIDEKHIDDRIDQLN